MNIFHGRWSFRYMYRERILLIMSCTSCLPPHPRVYDSPSCPETIHSVSRLQTDTSSSGESRRQREDDPYHLLLSLSLQRARDQDHSHVWRQVSCLFIDPTPSLPHYFIQACLCVIRGSKYSRIRNVGKVAENHLWF